VSCWLDQVIGGSGTSGILWAQVLLLSGTPCALVGPGWQISLAAVGISISLIEIVSAIAFGLGHRALGLLYVRVAGGHPGAAGAE